MKVAVEQALPCPPDARWHGHEISGGYAKVGVDEMVMGFMIWSLTSLDLKMRGHSEKYWIESFYGTRTTSRFQARPQGQHRLRVVVGHLHLHHLQEALPMTTATTIRVHLDHRHQTWVSHLHRRPLRKLSESVLARMLRR
jgi:hypothetical protein